MPTSAVRRQPQLNVEELLYLRWMLGGVLALFSIWTLFYMEATLWPLGVLGTVAITLAIAVPTLPGRIPRFVWRLGVPGIVVFFAADVTMNEMIPAFVRLNALLVLHRALSYRSLREDFQLIVLCLFLIVVTGVWTVSLVFAAQILLFAAVAMFFLFVLNILRDAAGDNAARDDAWALQSRKRFAKRLWQVFDLRVIGLAAALFAAVIGISTIIFLAIPRFQMENSLGLLSFSGTRSVTGFSETIALGEVTEIRQDNSIAMRVDVVGADFVPIVPYWRMVVLDEYGGGMFRVSRAVLGHVGVRSYPYIDIAPDRRSSGSESRTQARTYVVFLEGGISRFLPLPSGFQTVHFKEFQELVPNTVFRTYSTEKQSALMMSMRIEGADFGGVIPDPEFRGIDLRAPAANALPPSTHDENFPYRFLGYPATTLAVPVTSAERDYLRGLVARITGGAEVGPREFAARACLYLADEHSYSLEATLSDEFDDPDPVVRWMRGGSSGHCEFFAAAFTLLSRTAGFPTRAVTGFKGGSWNAYENYFMVRNSDAHAWCEVYDGDGSWFRVDPTPGAGGVSNAAAPVAVAAIAADHSFSAYLDSLRMLWYRRIVSFDQNSQRIVAGSLKKYGDTVLLWLDAARTTLWAEIQIWIDSPWTFKSKGDLVFVALLVLVAGVTMRRMGIGTADVLGWMRRGERSVRGRAGEFIMQLQDRRGRRRKGRRWDDAQAEELIRELTVIRYGSPASWPDPWRVFRSARRLL